MASLSMHRCMDGGRSLSRADWIDEGLRALRETSHEALRADPLAKRLGVSRGSFYWHFADVATFHRAVLERWAQLAVDAPLLRVAGDPVAAMPALGSLIDVAFRAPRELERAVHGWVSIHAVAAEAVAAVGRRRVQILADMVRRQGSSDVEAEATAVVLYWTYLGSVLSTGFPVDEGRLAQVRLRFAGPPVHPGTRRSPT